MKDRTKYIGKRMVALHDSDGTWITMRFLQKVAAKGRLRSLVLGGTRFSLIFIYDKEGGKSLYD